MFPRALVGVLLVSLGGCGGGGGGTCTCDKTITETVLGEADRDGWVTNAGDFSAVLPGPTGDIDGSSSNGTAIRQLFSLDHSGIPAGVTIVRATLRLEQDAVDGIPFATGGFVTVDHLDYGVPDFTSYALPALTAAYGTISSDAVLGPRTLDVTTAVLADRTAGRMRSQFRLRFVPWESDSDGQNDWAHFADMDTAAPGQEPALVVEYKP